jgi:molybdopterin molybdotransferase
MEFDRAIQEIQSLCIPRGDFRNVFISDALGFAMAQPIVASEPNPRFDNSEVDGYAICRAEDSWEGTRLSLLGSVAAGQASPVPIEPGTTARILTGAPVPSNTFGIAMQEDVRIEDGQATLIETIHAGAHIRRQGADFGAGEQLASVGTVIDPSVVALLAFVGLAQPLVFSKPLVTVITTGDELVEIHDIPSESQIRDTNSVMLAAQVMDAVGVTPTSLRVSDDKSALLSLVRDAANVSDVVILSGGASVGDRDYVGDVVSELGTVIFHGVSVRPGKPVLFGQIGECLVFGLPGNPSSAFVCFELFVKSALRLLAGWGRSELLWQSAVSEFDHQATGREDFVRVKRTVSGISVAGVQGSFGIWSLAQADGLARFPANRDVSKGSSCSVHWLR